MDKPMSSPPKIIADIAHPGTSAPSSNSKSVIVTNRSMLEDPMVNKPSAIPDLAENEKPATQDPKTKVEIKPIEEPEAAEEKVDKSEEKVTQPKVEDSIVETNNSESTDQIAPNEKAIDDKLKAEEIEKTKRDSAIQSLIVSKQYFLPINAVEYRRTKRFIVGGILFSFMLALVWVDIALDAGIIKLGGIKALTHLF
jgi:hypothetical protein